MKGPLGILMLDTRFPRIKGDIGNAQSFDFPVIFRRMEGIGSADAVTTHPDRPRVLAALEANARALVAEGGRPVDELRLPRTLPGRSRGPLARARRDLG
ncbi:MAG TPA: hypothetical protein VD858_21125, partial [Reyranella sp.]|nr:hypothetical protein [Reyranella sp.]